jgi:hypothetical protein
MAPHQSAGDTIVKTLAASSFAICLLLTGASAPERSADDIRQLKIHLMMTTKLIEVFKISLPADKYVSDGDPNTLEVVFLTKIEDGPSRVSDDGEVIFIQQGTSDQEQQDLTNKAFDIRVQRYLKSH